MLLGVLANVLGGISYYLTKVALTAWPPATLVFLRTLVALPLLLLLYRKELRPTLLQATRADWLRLVAIGTVGLALPLLLGAIALKDTESIKASILIGIEPISIALLSFMVLGERLGLRGAVAIGLGFTGAVLVVSGGDL